MLNALAPSGPAALVVPAAPPGLSDPAPPAQREAFKDVYHSVPPEQQASSEQKPKSKTSAAAKGKESAEQDENDKPAVIATPTAHPAVLLKAPLAFTIAAIGQAADPQTAPAEALNGTEDAAPGAGGSDVKVELPKMGLPLINENASLPIAQVSRNETIAFTAHLTQVDAPPRPVLSQRLSAPAPTRYQVNKEAQIPEESRSGAIATRDAYLTDAVAKPPRSEAMAPVRDFAAASAVDLRSPTPSQVAEPVHAVVARTIAVQDVQPVMPEIPKPAASSEIFLHLAGKDQSTASVRIVDRSGTVNVSVHASDPEVRNSLRANLGDLASQLSSQGFKTEMAKPVATAANAENQHDSHHNDTHSSGQQYPSAHDGRQSQRDRRANSQRWLEQLEQQTSGSSGTARDRN